MTLIKGNSLGKTLSKSKDCMPAEVVEQVKQLSMHSDTGIQIDSPGFNRMKTHLWQLSVPYDTVPFDTVPLLYDSCLLKLRN